MLFEFIETHRAEVIARALSLEPARQWPVASEEMAHGLPRFLTQVTDALRTADEPSKPGDPAIASSATLHAGELLAQGFTVSQLVHYYGNVCQSVTGLAGEHQCQISAYEFHILNRCLDTAIAESVTEFARVRELSVTHLQSERIGQVVHELRNKLHTAMLSFHVLKTGTVGISGSTGAVLGRSLQGLRDLVDGMIAEVRLVGAAPRPPPTTGSG
jgi:hypothetical protein